MAETFLHTVVAAASEYAIDVLNIVGNEYGWATGSLTTSTSTTTTTAAPGPVNVCNECDPPIPDTLYVTLAGLAGTFAWANDKHALTWVIGCRWQSEALDCDPSGGPIYVSLSFAAGQWTAVVRGCEQADCPGRCYKQWSTSGDDNECIPTADYTGGNCSDVCCWDTDSCEDSAGATCVVSYV